MVLSEILVSEIEVESPGATPTSTASNVTRVAESTSSSCCSYCTRFLDGRRDPENDLDQPCRGWPEVARIISQQPDFEAFQSFRDLNIKSLLYYQGELDQLRKALHRVEWRDHRRSNFEHAHELGKRVDWLLDCKDSDDEDTRKQMALITRIRQVLKEYNEALLQYSKISALPKASPINVNTLRAWLSNTDSGEYNIQGPGAFSWGDLTEEEPKQQALTWQFLYLLRSIVWTKKSEGIDLDLIVPHKGRKVDGLALWVANEWVPFCQSVRNAWQNLRNPNRNDDQSPANITTENKTRAKDSKSRKRKCNDLLPWTEHHHDEPDESTTEASPSQACKTGPTLNTYTEDRMLRFTSGVATVLACLLPTLAIVVLSRLHKTAEVLGLIAVFTAIFAIGLMLLTNAGTSRVEIFTATAAFSAVMVVFVQNQNQSQN